MEGQTDKADGQDDSYIPKQKLNIKLFNVIFVRIFKIVS